MGLRNKPLTYSVPRETIHFWAVDNFLLLLSSVQLVTTGSSLDSQACYFRTISTAAQVVLKDILHTEIIKPQLDYACC